MAVVTKRLVGTGDTMQKAADDIISQLPAGKHFGVLESVVGGISDATRHMEFSYISDKGDYGGGIIPTTTLQGTTYKVILNYAKSKNGIFFYNDAGYPEGCIVTMSDDSEYLLYYKPTDYNAYGNLPTSYTFVPYNASSATLKKVYVPNAFNGIVTMAPVVYQDTAIGAKGANSGDVLFVEGIDNSTWSPDGIEINGDVYWGCGKYCTKG